MKAGNTGVTFPLSEHSSMLVYGRDICVEEAAGGRAGRDFDRAERGQKSEAEAAGGLRHAGAQDRRF